MNNYLEQHKSKYTQPHVCTISDHRGTNVIN